jgi:hypothetical protein
MGRWLKAWNAGEQHSWDTLLTIVGDRSRKQVTNSLVAPIGFYRINSE